MYVDIVIVFGIAISQLFVTIYAVWVSVTEHKIKIAAVIATIGAFGIILTVWGAIRSGAAQDRLATDLSELRKGQQTANTGIQQLQHSQPLRSMFRRQ